MMPVPGACLDAVWHLVCGGGVVHQVLHQVLDPGLGSGPDRLVMHLN